MKKQAGLAGPPRGPKGPWAYLGHETAVFDSCQEAHQGAPKAPGITWATKRPSSTAAITVESSAVENSTPGLPFRVAGFKGERLPTLYPEHLARRRRRVPGAALGTVCPTALFSLYLVNGQHFPLRRPGGAQILRPSQSKAVRWRTPRPDYPFE